MKKENLSRLTKKQLEKFVKPIFAKKDPMHNWKHIKRIKKKDSHLKYKIYIQNDI